MAYLITSKHRFQINKCIISYTQSGNRRKILLNIFIIPVKDSVNSMFPSTSRIPPTLISLTHENNKNNKNKQTITLEVNFIDYCVFLDPHDTPFYIFIPIIQYLFFIHKTCSNSFTFVPPSLYLLVSKVCDW